MPINNTFVVHNVLRTYGQQVSRGRRIRPKGVALPPELADRVSLSVRARRKGVVEKVAAQVVSNLTAHYPGLSAEMEKEVIAQLSSEEGKNLAAFLDPRTWELSFKVVDEQRGEVLKDLSVEESDRLSDRLLDIIEQRIDQNMV